MTALDRGRRPHRWLCYLLWHRWTTWHTPPAGSCDHSRDCLRCGARETVAIHNRASWAYDRDGACEGHYSCTHCGTQSPDTDTRHVSDLVYAEPGACDKIFSCTRCGVATSKVRFNRHSYQWAYDEPGRCAGEDRCPRCGDTTGEAERHVYHWLVAATEQACRDGVCQRCAVTVTQVHDYRWVYEPDRLPPPATPGTFRAMMERSPIPTCAQRYECANCARADPGKQRIAHDWQETITSDENYRDCSRCSSREHWPYRD